MSVPRSGVATSAPSGCTRFWRGPLLGALDQLNPIVVGIANEAQERPALVDRVGGTLRLDPLTRETLERLGHVVDGERDVSVGRASSYESTPKLYVNSSSGNGSPGTPKK